MATTTISSGSAISSGSGRRLAHRAALAWPLLIACGSAHVSAQAGSTVSDLKQLDVEALMNVEVTSVSRHAEKLLDAASAIQVITQEDIRRSGATSIPEALRLATNLEVEQKNSHNWAISARGFNTDLANKLLVMIDGRTVYTPLYSGVYWDAQDTLLEDIDRIEVISGPGGTLWGTNAVNGVINIITKSAAQTQGGYAEAGGGTQLEDFAAGRYGGSVGDASQYRVYAKYFARGDEVAAGGTHEPDAWHQSRAGFRVDSAPTAADHLTLQGDVYDGRENVQTGGESGVSGQNVLGRWSRVFSSESDLSLQAYVDATHLGDPIPPLSLSGTELAPAGVLYEDLITYDIDFQDRFPIGSFNRVVWGAGYRHTRDAVVDSPAIGFLPEVLNQNRYSGFVQDEIALARELRLTIGTKLEHDDYTGFELEPNVRLSYTLSGTQSLWASVSRAVRTPSRVDRDLVEGSPPYPVLLEGGANFRSETVIAYETGYRAQVSDRSSFSASAFYNRYDDVRSVSYTPATILPLYFANSLEGDTYGIELSGAYRVLEHWSLHAGYTLLMEHLTVKPGEYDLDDAQNETADPKHQLSLRSSLDLPRGFAWDADLRWVDRLHINDATVIGTVPAYAELDTRLVWAATSRLELSLTGQNLLHDHHPEYGFPGTTRVEIERSVYGKAAWRF